MSKEMLETRHVTYEEFVSELKAQGVPRQHVVVKCFMCDTVQSMESFVRVGTTQDTAERSFGYSCVGRFRSGLPPDKAKGLNKGCDWTVGGLLSFSPYMVDIEGKAQPTFPPATPTEAMTLMVEQSGPVIVAPR